MARQLAYGEYIPQIRLEDTHNQATVLTIAKVREQPMGRGPDAPVKLVLRFAETFPVPGGWDGDTEQGAYREYILNATAYRVCALKFGPDHTKWVGRKVPMEPRNSNYEGNTFPKLHVANTNTWDGIIADVAAAAERQQSARAPRTTAKKTGRGK